MEVARFWRTRHQRYQLVGEICPHCGTKIFPPRDVCPACEGEAKTPFTFSGRGEVYSFTTIHSAPAGFEKYVPYVVALVRLEEGPLVTAQLTDVEEKDVYIGMPVEMVTRVLREDGERGMIVYGYKFRPRLLQPEPQPQRELEAAAMA
ncbi:MAG: Zn-ribbon domain-containing OB-fold protein [Thermoflexales bacterium]|nr:Zn-ribbon domain-containing OB-fold protein [Thermoflexales bacterium]